MYSITAKRDSHLLPRDANMDTNDRLVNEKEAAAILGLSVKTLQQWRFCATGPVYRKLGKAVRYSLADLQAYVESCAVNPVA